MTISSATRKAGPYAANGVTTAFNFAFKVFSEDDVQVVLSNTIGAETILTLTTDYTVSLNADQNANPGGVVTTNTVYSTGNKITLVGNVEFLQETDLTTGGGFYPEVIEDALDRLTMLLQQLNEQVDRAVKVDVSSTTDPDDLLDQITSAAATVQGLIVDAELASTEAQAALDSFTDIYLGAFSADPTTDLDGAALTAGRLYFNTAANELRVYNGVSWVQSATAEPASFTANTFSGTGAQTAFTLSAAPGSVQGVLVFVAGVRQRPTLDYTVSGTTLTFGVAPTSGTNNITTLVVNTASQGVPDDNTVSTAKLQDLAVTTAKLATNAVTTAKITDANITLAKLVANIFSGLTGVTPVDSDYVVLSDVSDSGNTKKALISDLLGLASGGFSNMQVFTSSGTFTPAAGITKVKVTVVGGGGGGGNTVSISSPPTAGGGASGALGIGIYSVTPGVGVTVTVGAGGTGGGTGDANGGTGGTSSFGAHLTCTGGTGGSTGTATGGVGGTSSGGAVNISGGSGATDGATSQGCTGAAAPLSGAKNQLTNATVGKSYGGGGNGRSATTNGTAGAGAPGIVIVEY